MRAVSKSEDNSSRPRARAWPETPPHPLEAPELYDGIRIKRLIAYAIDVVIISVSLVVFWAVGSFFLVISFGLLLPILALAAFLLPFTYHTLLIGGNGNATVGMRIMELRVVAWNGNSPSYAQAALQTFLFYASLAVATLLVLVVSFFNPRGRCLHDLLAGTVTINDLRLDRLSEQPEQTGDG
ncbi:MAG: RDD family protein [Rhodospirillaceae bacterium]|nr:RDD family protein [Rhodospirillaceae bacterium]MBT5193038.1 RDD family protein [Rhodospirillaceae bacterium]MBT5898854.1 RDD family protein [Rhodospirillaceae bacterium]MBT6426521.1 RDD family protein [Rhodospirillaceae bacterium]MBT7759810.1 RDD family protein [Rhodospirillaceae bacterium]